MELKGNKKGFTLIEIIVVVVILAVLMAVSVPAVLSYINEADDAKYIAQASGAFTSMQAELVERVSTGNMLDHDDVLAAEAAVWDLLENTKPQVREILPYVGTTPFNEVIGSGATVNDITSYKITFVDSNKVATVTPNGSIEISE